MDASKKNLLPIEQETKTERLKEKGEYKKKWMTVLGMDKTEIIVCVKTDVNKVVNSTDTQL